MSINKARSWLYWIARIMGDIQALTSPRKGAVKRRITRRIAGKVTGRTIMRGIGGMFR